MIKLENENYPLFYGEVGIEMNGVDPSHTTSGSLPSQACDFSNNMYYGILDSA
jgi:hypothetical protein